MELEEWIVLNKYYVVVGLESIQMSLDHSLERRDERNRILRCKGKILFTNNKMRRVIPSTEDYPQAEITTKQLALGMSRSLGHLILCKYGGWFYYIILLEFYSNIIISYIVSFNSTRFCDIYIGRW